MARYPVVSPSNEGAVPKVLNIFDVSAEFLGQLKTWLEENPPAIPLTQIVGYQQQTQATRVELATDQTINTASSTRVTFDSVAFDYGGMWDASSHVMRVRLAGKFVVGTCVSFAASDTGFRNVFLWQNASVVADSILPTLGTGSTTDVNVATMLDLTPSDVLWIEAEQTSGADLDIVSGTTSNFWFVRVGP